MNRLNKTAGLICGLATLLNACSTTDTHLYDESSQGLLSSMSAEGVERSLYHVTGDIYRFFDNNHSSLFVLTENGVVLIDPLNLQAAEWINGEIQSRFGKPITHVLYSHAHADHASGAAAFGDVNIISHERTSEVIQPVPGYRDVIPPTFTYSGDFYTLETDGKTIEMHYVGGNHAADMSYIFFPEESIVFYVDVISLRALPFGNLPWYSEADSANTYEKALAIDADWAIPSHGPIGTQDDVRDLREYMAELRSGVAAGIAAGHSLEQIQANLMLEDYADWDYYQQRRPQNIEGMYRALSQ